MKVGRENPAGLFATIVRKGLWGFIRLSDEDQGGAALKKAWTAAHSRGHIAPAPESCSPGAVGTATAPMRISVMLERVTSQLPCGLSESNRRIEL